MTVHDGMKWAITKIAFLFAISDFVNLSAWALFSV